MPHQMNPCMVLTLGSFKMRGDQTKAKWDQSSKTCSFRGSVERHEQVLPPMPLARTARSPSSRTVAEQYQTTLKTNKKTQPNTKSNEKTKRNRGAT